MNNKRITQFIFLAVISLVGHVIQSCGPATQPIPKPTFTLAPLDFVHCPPVTPIPPPIIRQPKVIYVLLDRSGSYGAYTKRATEVLIEGLVLSIEPGDRLHLIWLGSSEGDDKNWLVATVPEGNVPAFVSSLPTYTTTPLPSETPLPTATPSPRSTYAVLEQQAMTLTATVQFGYWTATADASSIIATNTAVQIEREANQQNCDQYQINNQNQILLDDFRKQRTQIVKKFIEDTVLPLKNTVPRGNDSATHIYNSLFYAARTIKNEKDTNQFRAFYLVLLSDMEDAGSKDGQNLVVDLADVNVLMAMVYCKDSIDCQNRSIYWEKYFSDRGALLPAYPFRLVDETTPYTISDFLK